MATTTTNLGLKKPAYTDDADIQDINDNMDLIDAEVAKVRGNVASDYDSAQTYAVGDYCIHDGDLYKCNSTISSPEAWTAGHWTQIKIAGELTALNGKIVNKENITVLTGTTGNTIGTGTEVTMPSGYTASNTVVIGMQYDDSGTWRVFGMLNTSIPCVISTTILSNNKINIIPRDNAGLNRNVKVTVFRYTT